MIQFSTTSQVTSASGVKILVYGGAGFGKTVLCATMPRPLIISAECGLLSLRKPNLEKLFGVGNPLVAYDIPVITITTFAQFREAYEFCMNSAEMKRFDSICVDSISEIAEALLNSEKKFHKDPRQAYGSMSDLIEEKVRQFRDIPDKHIYFSAKMEESKDGVTGAKIWQPAMPGNKIGPKLPYLFDEVFVGRIGVTGDGTQFRFLQTSPDTQYGAKDRSGALDAVEYPHLGTCITKILGA